MVSDWSMHVSFQQEHPAWELPWSAGGIIYCMYNVRYCTTGAMNAQRGLCFCLCRYVRVLAGSGQLLLSLATPAGPTSLTTAIHRAHTGTHQRQTNDVGLGFARLGWRELQAPLESPPARRDARAHRAAQHNSRWQRRRRRRRRQLLLQPTR